MLVVKITKTFPIRVTEWLMAGIMLSWSIALWNLSPQEFEKPIYIGMERIADSSIWAPIAFTIAFMRLAALARNGGWRPSSHLRAFGALVASFMWFQIALGQLMADQSTLGIAIYPWLFFADIYNVFRAMADARVSDDGASKTKRGRQSGANVTAT